MAVSPRSRRRATNVDATPTVPEYETQARIFVRANKAKNEQARIEKDAKAETHKAMLAVNLNRFELLEAISPTISSSRAAPRTRSRPKSSTPSCRTAPSRLTVSSSA